MEISQLTAAVTKVGDSISNYIFEVRNLLVKQGFKSNIYIEDKDFSSPFVKHYRACKPKEEDIMILHATIGGDLTDYFKDLKCKKMIIYHNHTPAMFFKGLNERIFRLLEGYSADLKSLIEYVDYAIADSEFNKQDLEKIGFEEVKVSPVPINFDRFKKINPHITAKFDDGYINIIHVGRIIPNKKIEDIIQVFYYYQNFINPKSRLFLVGSICTDAQEYYESLIKYVDKLKLQDVYFTSNVSDKDLTAYYKISDIYLSMSEHEGFAIPLVESMYFDTPIIAFNSTAIPHTLGNSGILVNKKDFKKIAELIDIILNDKECKNRILKTQRERLKYFDNKRVKKQFLQHVMNLKNFKIKRETNNHTNKELNISKNNNDSYNFLFHHPESINEIKILYIQPKGVGDIIMSTPIIKGLKKKYPYALIDFAADNYCKDIIVGNPHVNNVYSFDKLPNLQEYILVLRPYLKTQYMLNWQDAGIHIVDLYASLCGVELDDYKTELSPLKVNLQDYGIKEGENYICLHTKSSLKYKDWPYFKELIKKLKNRFKIVVIDEQQHNYEHTIQLPSNMKLREKAYIINKSKMLIGVDSMGIHMACALATPTIAIYGNTLPDLCKPLSNKNLITIEPKKKCTEGWHHFCKEGQYCINSISVNSVSEKVEELISKCRIY